MADTSETPTNLQAVNGGVRPIPDPTLLTTQLVDRGISALREILVEKIDGQKDLTKERFDGMDKAIRLLQSIADRMPAEIALKIDNLKELHAERFKGIATQFEDRDKRVEQTARDSKLAIDAALQAAKEAVGQQNKSSADAINKSELATTKLIDGLKENIDDVKTRLTRLESEGRGEKAAVVTQQTSNASTLGLIGAVVGVLGLIGGLVLAFVKP